MAPVQQIDVAWAGRRTRIEYRAISAAPDAAGPRPLVLFLHEGLGSLSTWKDFPDRLCARSGADGLVFSRWGYGRSSPRAHGVAWGPRFMHEQARDFLPAFLQALGLPRPGQPLFLYGHSDGASIALLYASTQPCAGVVAEAPHICVEALTVARIARLQADYRAGPHAAVPGQGAEFDWRQRLARHHADVDSAFFGWSQAWLAADFQGWDIRPEIAQMRCPVLALQGEDDAFGSMLHIDGLAALNARCTRLRLPACGHAPHREHGTRVLAAAADWMQAQAGAQRALAG